MSGSKTTTIFTFGFATLALGAIAVAVYCFDYYYPPWGRGMTYQVVSSYFSIASIVVAIGFYIGTEPIAAPLRWWRTFSSGGVFTLIFVALSYFAIYLQQSGFEQDQGLLILGSLTLASSFGAAKLLTRYG